jgi:hypothetical protein
VVLSANSGKTLSLILFCLWIDEYGVVIASRGEAKAGSEGSNSRSRSPSDTSSRSDSGSGSRSHRIRQSISNTIHRIENKIRPKPKVEPSAPSAPSAPSVPSMSYDPIKPKLVPVVPSAPYNPYNPVVPKPVPVSPSSPKVVPLPPFVPNSPYSKPTSSASGSKHHRYQIVSDVTVLDVFIDFFQIISSFSDILKTGSGSYVLSKLAKKIMGSGKHPHGSGNNYNFRPSNYENIQGSTCTNNVNYDGFAFGNFQCPMDGFDYSAVMCCGEPFEQFCCSPAEANEYQRSKYGSSPDMYDQTYSKQRSSSFSIFLSVLISVILLSLVGIGIMIFFVYKKRIANK